MKITGVLWNPVSKPIRVLHFMNFHREPSYYRLRIFMQVYIFLNIKKLKLARNLFHSISITSRILLYRFNI